MLEGLQAEHSLMYSRAVLGFTDFTPEERAALPAVVQPLVNTHPRTGRKIDLRRIACLTYPRHGCSRWATIVDGADRLAPIRTNGVLVIW